MARTLPRRLMRSRTDRMVAGVSGGLAAYFDADPTVVRLLFVVAAVVSGGAGVLVYLAMAVVVPEEPATTVRRTADPLAAPDDITSPELSETGEMPGDLVVADTSVWPDEAPERDRRHQWAGAMLILLGLAFLLGNLGVFRWVRWDVLWPLVLIAAGVLVLWNRWRN